MSIKKLFSDQNSYKTQPSASMQSLAYDAESSRNLVAKIADQESFIPQIDFSDPANFARYGSAEKYYVDAIQRIYKDFPYDGSDAEIQEFHNQSGYLDRWIFDYKYPRTTGYAIFSANGWGTQSDEVGGYGAPATASFEYIKIVGGPHTGSNEFSKKSIFQAFTGSNIYDKNIYDTNKEHPDGRSGTRESNLKTDLNTGVTIEFWLRKSEFLATADIPAGTTTKEVIFDLWNGIDVTDDDDDNDNYGRLTIELDGSVTGSSPFKVTLLSGSNHASPNGFSSLQIGNVIPSEVASNDWNHYAFVFQNSGSNSQVKFYRNGLLNETKKSGATINEITGALIANIGALRAAPSGTVGPDSGWGKLSGSIDEFRFWKEARTSKDIGRKWWTQVHGGTNSDIANATLGVYYKFNEGVIGTSSADSIVLDYSGRISNGKWTGYAAGSRSTGSAINDYTGSSFSEYKDPIIYGTHGEVADLKSKLRQTGSLYDYQNNASLINSLPSWIIEDEENNGHGHLNNLTQIIASYFDKLQLQTEMIPKLKDTHYLSSSHKPFPFAAHLLEHVGLAAPEIFVDATILEKFMNRDEDRKFELKLNDIKNSIYHNIYNNIAYIYKTKGTEKSYRNLFHCFGVDDNLLHINLYGDNDTYTLEDNFRNTVVRKIYIDCNHPDRFDGTVFQYADTDNTNSVGFITGSGATGSAYPTTNTAFEDYLGMTVECEAFLPRKIKENEVGYFHTNFTASSLFGMHTVNPQSSTTLTWGDENGNDYANFQVSAIKTKKDSDHVTFQFTSSVAGMPLLTSSVYYNAYDDQKWNLAVRIKTELHPLADRVSGSTSGDNDDYIVELYGNHSTLDYIEDEFHASASIDLTTAQNFLRSSKRLYAGAHLENFTGDVLESSDAQISSLRYWSAYLSDEVLRIHARDPENVGIDQPSKNAFLLKSALSGSSTADTPRINTLALDWDFATITGSDDSGEFIVLDASSGSANLTGRHGFLGNLRYNQHSGMGYNWPFASKNVFIKKYVQSAKSQPPEILNSSEMVNILEQDDDVYTRDHRIVNYYLAIEKSMYRTISEEMVNMFATIKDYANLIAEPGSRYRNEYKAMGKLRQLFFERINNTPDLDKYVEYYKWLDSSLNALIEQLSPLSTNMSNRIRTVVESHMLERNKYVSKFPASFSGHTKEEPNVLGITKGIEERLYDWEHGHHPLSDKQADNALWWKARASRSKTREPVDKLTTMPDGSEIIDCVRQKINNVINENLPFQKVPTFSQGSEDTLYGGSAYALRRFNKHVKLTIERNQIIHGGTNYHPAKKRDLVYSETYIHGPITSQNIPRNVMVAFAEDQRDFVEINDENTPPELRKVSVDFRVRSGRHWSETGSNYDDGYKSALSLPFNAYSASIQSGYNKVVHGFFSGTTITNLHSDTYGSINEVPMQGPFTEKYVGGHQSRHVDLNLGSDNQYNRPEAWRLVFDMIDSGPPADGNAREVNEGTGALGFVGPDYGGPYPDTNRQYAARYRDGIAKRPVNIRNIQHKSSSNDITVIGNYTKNHNIIQTAGRSINNSRFKENTGITLPDLYHSSSDASNSHSANLQKTTNVHSWWATRALSQNKMGNSFIPNPKLSVENTPGDDLGVGERSAHDLRSPEYITSLRTTPQGSATSTEYTLTPFEDNKTIIASRFSAPGGPEVLSRGYLDVAAEEYSVYNSINFRNYAVRGSGSGEAASMRMTNHLSGNAEVSTRGWRDGLSSLLTRHCGEFGIDNVYGSVLTEDYNKVPSYHKVHRNRLKRLQLDADSALDEGVDIAVTASHYDNWWVQRPIPQNYFQYSWINASIDDREAQPLIGGYIPESGKVSTVEGDEQYAIKFLESSEVASVSDIFGTPQGATQNNVNAIRTSFAGINTNIVEPFTSSTNTLGYPLSFPIEGYLNIGDIDQIPAQNVIYDGGFLAKFANAADKAMILNSLILHRQGPYGWPTWKQIRNSNHPIVRHHRKNNILSIVSDEQVIFTGDDAPEGTYTTNHTGKSAIQYYNTSPVTTRYSPMQITFVVSDTPPYSSAETGELVANTVTMQTTYANNLAGFDDTELNDLHGPPGDEDQTYDQIKTLYLDGGLESDSPVAGFSSLLYKEAVYPAAINMYTANARGRQSYQNNFWRKERADRDAFGLKLPSSLGHPVSQSCWPLDEPNTIFGAANSTAAKFPRLLDHEESCEYSGGELMNLYCQFHHTDEEAERDLNITASAQYARLQSLPISGAFASPTGRAIAELAADDDNSIKIAANFAGDFNNNDIRKMLVPLGVTRWEAHELAGYLAAKTTTKGQPGATRSSFGRQTSARSVEWVDDPAHDDGPWYQDYDNYVLDLRAQFKDYSIVPEFRISDHMDFYIKEAQGNFRKDNDEIFSIFGAPNSNSSVPQNSSQENFYKTFSNSDFMKYFDLVKDEHEGFIEPGAISLTCKAGIKFIPYDGFFPAQRTVQLASQFSASYASNVGFFGDDNTKSAAMRVFLQPFFAPGIMFNAIKSGMAVDWPVMLSGDRLTKARIDTTDYYGLTVAASSTFSGLPPALTAALTDDEVNDSIGEWDYRIPFEALVEPEKYIKKINLFDMEPHPSASLDVTASWDGTGDNRYKLMMNNFLAETAEFFLADGDFTKIRSQPESKLNLSLTAGDIYGARVRMKRSLNKDKIYTKEHFAGRSTGSTGPLFELPQDPKNQGGAAALRETFTMYSRTTAFGPPVLGRSHGNAVHARAASVSGALDSIGGYNWSFTPPYYHGEAWADLIFRVPSTANYTIKDIIEQTTTQYWRVDAGDATTYWRAQSHGGTYAAEKYDEEPRYVTHNGNKDALYSGKNINLNAMQMTASVNLFGTEKVTTVERLVGSRAEKGGSLGTIEQTLSDAWVIQPKYETPMVNFNHSGIRPITAANNTLTLPGNILSASVSRGMWHQFGNIPETSDKGIFLQIGDIPSSWLRYHYSGSVADGFYTPGKTAITAQFIHKEMKSLPDLVGFSSEAKRLGEIATKKTVKEAVVAVPFMEEDGERKFFEISQAAIDGLSAGAGVLYDAVGDSIKSMISKMENYVFPPSMDFLKYDDITPFAMYVFEFEYDLDQDDLNYIWQNLAPRGHKVIKSAEATISHQLLTTELMGYAASLHDQPIQDRLQWMVFKVKQKAKTNYFNKISLYNPEQSEEITSPLAGEDASDYSYNWPYDFFSFVEMVKLEASVEFAEYEETIDAATREPAAGAPYQTSVITTSSKTMRSAEVQGTATAIAESLGSSVKASVGATTGAPAGIASTAATSATPATTSTTSTKGGSSSGKGGGGMGGY